MAVDFEPGVLIVGKYRLMRLLGTGGMASVWSAVNVFTDRKFAIKFMLPMVARSHDSARRFLLEAKASARINHPNIIEVIDVGQTEDGTLFLVMELLAGATLETLLEIPSRRMTLGEFTSLMIDVARGLHAAHTAGVIHRDLKPTNIFLHQSRGGRATPKILDFGVSKFMEVGEERLTVAGAVLGSPMYMSPEQAIGAMHVDSRTDVFSFGALLFEGFVGHRCFEAPNYNALLVRIATTQPQSIDMAAPHLPEELRAIIRTCLSTDPTMRPPMNEVALRLEAILPQLHATKRDLPMPDITTKPRESGGPLSPHVFPSQPPSTPLKAKRRLTWFAFASAFVAVLSALIFFAWEKPSSHATAPLPTVELTSQEIPLAVDAGPKAVEVMSVDSLKQVQGTKH